MSITQVFINKHSRTINKSQHINTFTRTGFGVVHMRKTIYSETNLATKCIFCISSGRHLGLLLGDNKMMSWWNEWETDTKSSIQSSFQFAPCFWFCDSDSGEPWLINMWWWKTIEILRQLRQVMVYNTWYVHTRRGFQSFTQMWKHVKLCLLDSSIPKNEFFPSIWSETKNTVMFLPCIDTFSWFNWSNISDK